MGSRAVCIENPHGTKRRRISGRLPVNEKKSSSLILVVDDNYAGQLLVCAVLELDGYRVDSATSPDEVLARTSASAPDLILMDVELPGQDGLALARKLRSDPATATIPIVALTAHTVADFGEQALSAGCSGFISKPIDIKTLARTVRVFLEQAQAQ
jgi:CheY-like chemotaxis protein